MLPDTPSPESLPTQHLAKSNLHTAQNGNAQEPPIFFSASQAYTSKAAEHWRGSWRDRQYAEAGPAEDVSKGQASVSSPLQSMQNSIVRMRAVILKQKEDKRKVSFGFWMTILLMICLIGGLSAYIFYSYLPNSSFNAAHLSQPAAGQSPSLSIEGTTTTTFKIGQTLHITGSHFGAHDTITFLLDTTTPITNSNGSPLRVQTDSKGAFGVSITIGKNWPTGDRNIQAVDANANTSSYLDIQIIPASKPVTSSPDMSISLNDQPIPVLTFTKRVGQADPPAKRITITNTSNAVLQWSAEVSTDQNLGWLVIEDNNYSGQLAISEPQEIGIGVDATGLGITQLNKPYIQYKGQVLFTINNTEVLTLPVQLTITNASAELVFSPTPVIGMAKNGSCQAGSTLTLINLGAVIVSWAVNPDEAGFIQFVDNQGKSSGTLQPSGTAGDTVVLTLRCAGVSKDQAYSLSIYGNGIPARDTVMIQ